MTKDYDNAGNVTYVQYDPRTYTPKPRSLGVEEPPAPSEANVYDPRLTGYGTSYRGFLDPLLGQPQFMYDDIDAVRGQGYISRSNIDNQPFADSIGIKPGFENGNPYNSDIRVLAQDAWFQNSTAFRNDLQESLMRKVNANAWQQRVAPIHTNYRVR